MSRVDRRLTVQEFDEIVVAVRGDLERGLRIINEYKILGSDRELPWRRFHLEFDVVTPLYRSLQRHLIDWGTRKEHKDLPYLRLTHFLDERGYRYYDIIPIEYRGI